MSANVQYYSAGRHVAKTCLWVAEMKFPACMLCDPVILG